MATSPEVVDIILDENSETLAELKDRIAALEGARA